DWRHYDVAAGADTLLQQAVVLNTRVRHHTRASADREAGGVVNMVVTVAGIGRRLQFRRPAPSGIRRLLGVTVPEQKSRGRCCENGARSALNESPAGDHVAAFLDWGLTTGEHGLTKLALP